MSEVTSIFVKQFKGENVYHFTLQNDRGITVRLTNYGATVTHILLPDQSGDVADVTLGYESVNEYFEGNPYYFGSIVGRCANRIARGEICIENKTYHLARNDGNANHLHGGHTNFSRVVWQAEAFVSSEGVGVKLSYFSPHLEEGYPGNLEAQVIYLLTEDNQLQIDYRATSDATTIFNPTSHIYFNLDNTADCQQHLLQINAAHYLPIDERSIPTGQILPVADTVMDFRQLKAIGENLQDLVPSLKNTRGYDHTWVLDKAPNELALVAQAVAPISGRRLKVWTTFPGVHFYAGNFFDKKLIGKNQNAYPIYAGFCLEAQYFPDAIHHPNFASPLLLAGQNFEAKTIFDFR